MKVDKHEREDIDMRGLATALASIMKAIAHAMASFTWRWCEKTGSWVMERVVQPTMDYTADAASGALAGVTGFIPDVIRSAARLPGQAIRGTGAVLEGGGRLAGSVMQVAAAVPGAIANGLAGGRGGAMMPPPPPAESKAEKAVRDAADLLERHRLASGGLRRADQMMMRRSDILGEAIHAYAFATPAERATMDLGGIPEAIQDWLLTATSQQLARLAAAGPVTCGLMASGQRRIVGIDMPTVRPEPMEAPLNQSTRGMSVGDVLGSEAALAARIAAARGVESGRRPAH